MISEQQAKRMLSELEKGVGKRFASLRKSLLRNRISESALWELIVLYVAYKACGEVEHEPADAFPDVLIAQQGIALEAHVVFSKREAMRRLVSEFEIWIVQQIRKAGIDVVTIVWATELIDSTQGMSVPERHLWAALRRGNAWRVFLDALRETGRGVWYIDEYNLKYSLQLTRSSASTGRSLLPPLPESVESSPIYGAVRRKAKQIRAWGDSARSNATVLVIGAFEPGSEFDDGGYGGRGNRDQVIWSSLIDPSDLDPVQAYNVLGAGLRLGEGGFKATDKSLRVPGSSNISAIVFVQLKTQPQSHTSSKEAEASIYINPKARVPLNDGQIETLKMLDFSVVEYGPGWEAWQGNARGSMAERNLRRGGGWLYRELEGGGFVVEVPAISITQVLSGLRSVEQVFGDGNDNLCPQKILARALEDNCELLGVQLIEPDSQREEQRVRLEFGPPEQALISRAKDS